MGGLYPGAGYCGSYSTGLSVAATVLRLVGYYEPILCLLATWDPTIAAVGYDESTLPFVTYLDV